MVRFEKYAALIVTDSGGVQKEAFFHSVPCVTIREETEWTELVESGWNRIAPPDSKEALLEAFRSAIHCVGKPVVPYGDGYAAEAITKELLDTLFG